MRVSTSTAWQPVLAVMVVVAGCVGAGVSSGSGASPSAPLSPPGLTAAPAGLPGSGALGLDTGCRQATPTPLPGRADAAAAYPPAVEP